jgi:hypothetical protein
MLRANKFCSGAVISAKIWVVAGKIWVSKSGKIPIDIRRRPDIIDPTPAKNSLSLHD